MDDTMLRAGDHLVMPDSSETFTVSKTDSLIGVYNINKGYADFKIVSILDENDEYAIVQPNTTYGLSAYDHIVLDAEAISKDEEIVY